MGLFGHNLGEEVILSEENKLNDWVDIDTEVNEEVVIEGGDVIPNEENKLEDWVHIDTGVNADGVTDEVKESENTQPENSIFLNLKFDDFLHTDIPHQETNDRNNIKKPNTNGPIFYVDLQKKNQIPVVQKDRLDDQTVPSEEAKEEVFSPTMKFKEIKYGMSVLINTGNFENVRTHVEVTAEIEEVTKEDELRTCINALRKQILEVGRNEYKEIKYKQTKK